jgi:hypothetical protein
MHALLALALAAASPALTQPLARSLAQSLVPGARLEVVSVTGALPSRCQAADYVPQSPIEASGPVVVRATGQDPEGRRCEAWLRAEVKVYGPVWTLQRPVALGVALDGAAVEGEREWVRGRRYASAVWGRRAARALAAGVVLTEAELAPDGPQPGQAVLVRLRVGALTLTEQGRLTPCERGSLCARLESGKRVQGRWAGDALEVVSP